MTDGQSLGFFALCYFLAVATIACLLRFEKPFLRVIAILFCVYIGATTYKHITTYKTPAKPACEVKK